MVYKVRNPPDPDTLRHQIEVEQIPLKELMKLYGYADRSGLYRWCQLWNIKLPPMHRDKYQHLTQIPLSTEQRQIVLGALLGDGHLSANVRYPHHVVLHMAQGEKQRDYLEWKKVRLEPFIVQSQPYQYQQRKFSDGFYYMYRSIAHPEFRSLRELMYPEKKKIVPQSILNELGPLGVAVWLMDDGSFMQKSGWMSIATHSFSEAENHLIAEWFKQRFDIEARVYPNRRLKQHFLCFNRPAVDLLRELVKDHFFPPLLYKLGLGEETCFTQASYLSTV